MQNNKIFLLACTASFLSCSALAFIGNKNTPSHLFICPTSFTCSKDDDAKSCKIEDKTGYWKTKGIIGTVVKDTYTFIQAESSFEEKNAHQNFASCEYESSGRWGKMIILNKKPTVFIEAAAINQSKWKTSDSAFCKGNAEDCPFYEPGLMIDKALSDNKKTFLKAQFSANDHVIKNDDKFGYDHYRFSSLTNDEALSACGSVTVCDINITLDASYTNKPTYPITVGSIKVDMRDHLKIINISSLKNSGYTIIRRAPFNTITFEKSDQK